MKTKLILTILLSSLFVCNAQITNIDRFSTLIKPNHNIALTNPVFNENSLMTYDIGQVNTNGGAFKLNFTNNNGTGGPGYKGYPSGSIGAFKSAGNYTPGNPAACGMPIQIANLKHDLRIKWKVSQFNAYDPDDKWWASINVVFDTDSPLLEPLPANRDYDLVIELNRYEQENYDDVSSVTNQTYWYYARNSDGSLKTLDFNYNGVVYSWVVRYKFFNNPINTVNNDKVHVKFTPLFNVNCPPFLDHSLKKFIDTSVNYLQNVNLTPSERALAELKVGNPDLYIKNINAGYEVYTGNFTITNDYLYTVLDSNPPTAPTNLIASKIVNQVNLNWNDNVDQDFNTYKIYRSINGASYSLLAENVNVSNFVDNTTTIGNNYSYYVVADDRSYNVSSASNSQNVNFTILYTQAFESEINLKVSPNPFFNELNLEFNDNVEKMSYEIFNLLNQVVSKGSFTKSTTINTSNIDSGIYFLHLNNGKTIEVRKLIKK
jgi:hypothetical protein